MLASTILLSSMLIPAAANASPSPDDATAPTQNLHVSTGVIAPTLAQSLEVQIPESLPKSFIPVDSEVGLSLTVDSSGQAQNIKVVKSANPYWDARVVDAIQKSHFRPGTVDNTPVPVELDLTIVMAH